MEIFRCDAGGTGGLWGKVTVPAMWGSDGYRLCQVGLYRTGFKVAEPAPGRVYLNGQGFADKAELWLNGRKIGSADGFDASFTFDITDALEPENVLAVRIENRYFLDGTYYGGIRGFVSVNTARLVPDFKCGVEERHLRSFLWSQAIRGTSGVMLCYEGNFLKPASRFLPGVKAELENLADIIFDPAARRPAQVGMISPLETLRALTHKDYLETITSPATSDLMPYYAGALFTRSGGVDVLRNGDLENEEYAEDIYVGYRWFDKQGAKPRYPFGYGLSYTTFDWTVGDASASEIELGTTITVPVTVKNTGSVAGKEVVQLYASAPYTLGGIEKAHKVLVGFAKTKLLQPGESETVTVSFDPYSAASYDYRDANSNGFSGYELEAGEYTLYISRNAHESEKAIALNLAADVQIGTDPTTDSEVVNRYTDSENFLDSDWQLDTMLSRADWEGTWPTPQTAQQHAGTDRLYEEIRSEEHNNPTDFDSEEYPWFGEEPTLTLRDLLPSAEAEGYEPVVSYDDERWEELMMGCDEEEMIALINNGAYHTLAMESVGLPATIHGDGPSGFTCFMSKEQVNGTCQYVSEPVMASTWNINLMNELGEAIGEEGTIGDKATGQPYSSIYAPGVNIHRSPFGGRCSEYFSEDPFISGMMGAAEVQGIQSRGVLPTVKHFVANEQETHRSIGGDLSWLSEQALREIYLKPFEYTVKLGETRGIMTSFNRIGTRWTGGDYRLLTEILRNEWGFNGLVICDFNTIPQYMIPRMMFYAGGSLDLATQQSAMWTDCDTSDAGDAIVLMRAVKDVMYALVNSNAMNAEVIGYNPPIWQEYLHWINIGAFTLVGVWLVLAIVRTVRCNKRQKAKIAAANAAK